MATTVKKATKEKDAVRTSTAKKDRESPVKVVRIDTRKQVVRDVVPYSYETRYRTKYPVDTAWFKDRLAGVNLSLRGLAKAIGLEPSAVSLTLNGRRKMSVVEAGQIANVLGAPVEEVLRRAGGDLPVVSENLISVKEHVDGAGIVHRGPGVGGPGMVSSPATGGAGLKAIRVMEGPMRGWVLFYREGDGIHPRAVECLSVVQGMDGARRLGWLKPGLGGTWALGDVSGGREIGVRIENANPIWWVFIEN